MSDIAPHSKFINMFSEIAIPGPEVTIQYPAIGRAMEYLRSVAEDSASEYSDKPLLPQEIERLTCMVYISFACTRSLHTWFDLSLLNELLERTEEVWVCSVSSLRWLLTQSVGKGPDGLRDTQRTGRLAEISRLLTWSSYSNLERRYLDILLEPNVDVGGLLSPEK
jgi:hypothetical protein